MQDLIKEFNFIMENKTNKNTLDLLAYSVGYFENLYPELSKFLDFILMADKNCDLPKIDLEAAKLTGVFVDDIKAE